MRRKSRPLSNKPSTNLHAGFPFAWRGAADADGAGSFWASCLSSTAARHSKATIATARQMGVDVKMVTGDQVAIAREIAREVGLGTNILDASGFGDTKLTKQQHWSDRSKRPTALPKCFRNTNSTSSMCCSGAHIVG